MVLNYCEIQHLNPKSQVSKDFGTSPLAYPLELITKNPAVRRGSVEMSESDSESKNYIKKLLQA